MSSLTTIPARSAGGGPARRPRGYARCVECTVVGRVDRQQSSTAASTKPRVHRLAPSSRDEPPHLHGAQTTRALAKAAVTLHPHRARTSHRPRLRQAQADGRVLAIRHHTSGSEHTATARHASG